MLGALVGKQAVDLLACLDQDLGRSGNLRGIIELTNLLHSSAELATFGPQGVCGFAAVCRGIDPGLSPGLTLGVDKRPPSVSEGEDPLAVLIGRGHQAVLSQSLQHRIDGAGRGLPLAIAAIGELGQDLVSVSRLLSEQQQDGVQDVAALASPSALGTPWASAAASPRVLSI